jgi:hypothetical protein
MGGIAGITMRGELDTSTLPAEEAESVEAGVRELAAGAPGGPPRPDGFRYEITPLDDAGAAPIVVGEQDLPPALRGAVASAAKAGEIES